MKKLLSKFYLLLIFIFLYFPILFLIVYSFNDSKFMVGWGGFTLRWYGELAKNSRLMSALYYTVIIAILSAIISTALGTISAIGINKLKSRSRALLLNINYLPVLNPDIVTGISLMLLFKILSLKLGFLTLLLAHIAFNTPLVILSVLPKLKQLPSNIEDAALDLGATPFYAIRRIVIPLIKPGIISGFIIAFTMSIDDFVISFFNTSGDVTNLSIEIFSMARRGVNPQINALSAIMFTVIISLLLIANKKQSLIRGD